MTAPLVSVIIPTFNRKKLIGRAVSSVLRQTYTHLEIIVVDDNSSDGTLEYLNKDYRSLVEQGKIKLLSNDRTRGPAGCRNKGIVESRADYIAFLDSDDEFSPQKIEKQIDLMEREKNLLYCHTNELWFFEGEKRSPKKKHRKRGGFFFERALKLCLISPSAVMMRKSFFREVGLWNENLLVAEDYELWIRAQNFYPAGYLEEPLTIKHGGEGNQLSSSFYNIDLFRIYALLELLQTEYFKPEKRLLILKELRKKWQIMEKGALKKGRILNPAVNEQIYNYF